ncbi:hypothetical protein C464_17397 [Halorubrum coriense DSM 10284]|uniref:Uncharacterized protein n=1 Tax=Halorubrum coriense DSM 10284 TaxID=1227466 RepID=M0E6G5_9EURY|nr:hypothetical protein C464_17397 [Halorubrum coriense DSM 10284]
MEVEEALSPEAVREVVRKIQRYLWEEDTSDAQDRINSKISDQFWKTVTRTDESSGDDVPYESLANGVADLIGYIESEDDDDLPWWLHDFEWSFESTGDGEFSTSDGDLERLESFDPNTTRVKISEYSSGSDREDLDGLIDGIVSVRDELVKHTDIDDPSDLITGEEKERFPDSIFSIMESDPDDDDPSRIETTGEFNGWLKELVRLCPPFNRTTTALIWYNVGLPVYAVEDLGVDVDVLTDVGLSDEDDDEHVYSSTYRNAFADIMRFRGVFDREVAVETEDTEMGAGLELAYIDAWASATNQLDDEKQETIRMCSSDRASNLDDNERSRRAPHCLELPVRYDYDEGYYLTFDTQCRGFHRRLSKYNDSQHDRSKNIVSALGSRYNLLATTIDG